MSWTKWFLLVVVLIALVAGASLFSKKASVSVDNNSIDSKNNKMVTLKTNLGDIKLELFTEKAPNTVTNFVNLANEGFYNNTKFHRVIKDFMIQGGDPNTKDENLMAEWGKGGPDYRFADEINDVKLVRGILAMANAGPNTNGSQFFIVTAEETPWLDGKHTAFGRVVSGMEVVDKIEASETTEGDRPVVAVVVSSVVVE